MNKTKSNSNLEFRKIKSLYFLYEINENGTIIRNVKSKKQLHIKLDTHHSKKGYYCTFVHGNKWPHGKRVMIHKVVAECWLGDCPSGYEIDHKDRNSLNNHYTNLRYVTKSEQMKNRDHTNIAKKGTENLKHSAEERSLPVKIIGNGLEKCFPSKSACAYFLSQYYNKKFSQIRWKLDKKYKRKKIYDFDIIYLNATTVCHSSKEQETVYEK